MMPGIRTACLAAMLILSPFAASEEEAKAWLQLQRLNQASGSRLDSIQRRDRSSEPSVSSMLDQQQRSALNRLQERQRRQQLIDSHRRRISPLPPGLSTNPRQRLQKLNNTRAQQHQLQRFRLLRQRQNVYR